MSARPWRRYLHALAERLGMSVRRLLSEMDSREISEWIAYDLLKAEEVKRAELKARVGAGLDQQKHNKRKR